ncbi:hypothetical protein ABIB06_006549 [Bradyrhizobium sp. LB8.2]
MLRNHLYSPDGASTVHLDAGSVYELPEEISQKLISEGLAVLEPKAKKSTKES